MKKTIAILMVLSVLFLAGRANADLKKEVSIWINRNVAPSSKIQLSINTTNVPTVHMTAQKVSDVTVILNNDIDEINKSLDETPVKVWDINLKTKRESPQIAQRDVYRNRQINLPFLTPGAYVITAEGGNKKVQAVVNVTNLAVVTKRSSKRILIWVTDAINHKTLSGVKITLIADSTVDIKLKNGKMSHVHKTQKYGVGMTGNDGVCIIKNEIAGVNTVFAEKGNDKALASCGEIAAEGVLKTHIQTDRPIYRPGQTVMYKAILRLTKGHGYTPVSNQSCKVVIKDPQNNVLDEQSINSNAIGTLAGSFEIPSEAPIGAYTLQVEAATMQAYYTFSVAEYRKTEYKVTVAPEKKRYLSGENVVFNVNASYYFGADLQQAPVTYKVSRTQSSPWGESDSSWQISNDGNLYARDTYGRETFIAEGTVTTDDKGNVSIPIKTVLGAPDSDYSITCTVKDASQREVTESSSVTVYAAGLRLAMSTGISFVNLGSIIPVKLSAVDLDGKPAAAEVILTTGDLVWDNKSQQYKYREISRTKVTVPNKGVISAKVPAKTQGELFITAMAVDAQGRKTQIYTSVWVAGSNVNLDEYNVDKTPKLTMKLDKASYIPGKIIKAWCKTNQLDRPLLISAECQDIWKYKVIPAGKRTFTWEVPTTPDMTPNVYIVLSQWTSHFLLTQTSLAPIPDLSHKLLVKIEPSQTVYKPGDKAEYIIHTTGQDGHPVPAEVAIGVIDESLYTVRPDTTSDVYDTYWGIRDNRVVTTTFSPAEAEGGAYQRAETTVAPIRQRFVDTAFWNAQVATDKDGLAKISFEMPGNLTKWRATARAVTADTSVGTGKVTTMATRPVTFRLAAPRQFVKGDNLTLIATINNRTGISHEFETSISSVGLTIEGDKTQKITVPGNKEGTVEWKINADSLMESGNASITGRILAIDAKPEETADLSDALKISVKVAPDGIQHRIIQGGTMESEKSVALSLPVDRIEPASTINITLHAGFAQVAQTLASVAIGNGLYAPTGPADHLLALAINGKQAGDKDAREAMAALYARQNTDRGWGWWDSTQSDPELTSSILSSLARALECGISISPGCISGSINNIQQLFSQQNLWERSAQMASAVNLFPGGKYTKLLDTAKEKGTYLSPFTQLSIAEAYLRNGHTDWAESTAKDALQYTVAGPEIAYVPAGNRSGWMASTVETTAQALILLTQLPIDNELQPKLAQWLVEETSKSWLSEHEQVLTAYALKRYVDKHPQSINLGTPSVTVNGVPIELIQVRGNTAKASIPAKMLQTDNAIVIKRDAPGEIFYSIEARVFQPVSEESHGGMRVLRRYEIRNAAGLWEEMQGKIKPSDPVRCTVVVWPNDRPDTLRVVESIPSGFEYINSEYVDYYTQEEVRDGAVIHYFCADKNPVYFRYYLRPESEGTFKALPAYAEAIRRPSLRGNSEDASFVVEK